MNGFLSYSHDDYDLYLAFRPHLYAFGQEAGVTVWTDHKIYTGQPVDPAIAAAIDVADVFVLLVSAEFIFSGYVRDIELPAIEAREKAGALVLPVQLNHCAVGMIAKGRQVTPSENKRPKPVVAWRPYAAAFDCARREMLSAVRHHFALTP